MLGFTTQSRWYKRVEILVESESKIRIDEDWVAPLLVMLRKAGKLYV
jgi:hypothetical protein